jgi:hypothetical protein
MINLEHRDARNPIPDREQCICVLVKAWTTDWRAQPSWSKSGIVKATSASAANTRASLSLDVPELPDTIAASSRLSLRVRGPSSQWEIGRESSVLGETITDSLSLS